MFLTDEQIRFNRSCNQAMLGYASAMSAATGIIGNQMFSLWAEAMAPAPTPSRRRARSKVVRRRVHVPARSRTLNGSGNGAGRDFNWFVNPWIAGIGMAGGTHGNPFAAFGAQGNVNGFMPGGVEPADMMGAWFSMDWSRAPASWPMAYWMMASGVPREVASPIAEANLAMIDAFNAAGGIAQRGILNSGVQVQRPVAPNFFGAGGFNAGANMGREAVDVFGFAAQMPNMFFKP